MLAVIDYGAGNLRSVVNALEYLKVQNSIVQNEKEIADSDALILPGVGAFGAAMEELEARSLKQAVLYAARSKPFLGICLGMQLLFEESEESPGVKGLGVLKGRVRRFPSGLGLKIPHMGWNSLRLSENSRLLSCLKQESCMYFVHSYFCDAKDKSVVSASCDYGVTFDAAVEKDNVFGCQFHPEKSGGAGLSVLARFASLFGGGR